MAGLTDAEMRQQGAHPMPAAAPSGGLTDAEMAAAGATPIGQTGLLESFGRGAVEGATLGFDGLVGGEDWRAARERSRTDNPWTHFAGEIAGGIAPMVATGGAAAALKGGTTVAAKVGHQALRPFVSAPVSTIGQASAQGAKLGAAYGAVSGLGHSRWDSASEGLQDAAKGAMVGGMAGGVMGPAAYKFGEKVAIARAASREMANADTASLAAIDRALARDAIDPSVLRGQIEVPQYGKLTPDQITDLATRVGRGEALPEAAQAVGIGEGAARKAVGRFDERNATPLSIVDRARMTGGENTSWTLRAGMATPGTGRAQAAESLTLRQTEQPGRIADAADRIVRAGDPSTRLEAMKAAEKAAYDAAYATEKPFDIAPQIAAVERQYGTRQTDIAREMQKAAGIFAEKTPGRPPTFEPFRKLAHFQEGKLDLDQMIAGSMKDGRPTPLTRRLTQFKADLMQEVSSTNPSWRAANDMFAENSVARRLFGDAETQSFRITADTRREMDQVRRMHKIAASRTATAEQKAAAKGQLEMYRDGLAEAIKAHVLNKGETADRVGKFLTPAGRSIIETTLGAKDGAALLAVLKEEQAITRTYRGLGGSQTTPLREAIDELNGPAMLASAWDLANPRKLMEMLVAKGARTLVEKRNNRMVPMLTESDPLKQLALIRDIEAMRKARVTGGGTGVSGVAPFANALQDQGRPQRRRGDGMAGRPITNQGR